MITPGFTGSPLDRSDAIRHDADAFAAAASDWRARLLKLDGLVPEVSADGMLVWTTLADAADDAVLVLLGLIDDRPHFAAWLPGLARGDATPMRSPVMTAALSLLRPEEASTYASARSVLDWHDRHRFCANCGNRHRRHSRGVGASLPPLRRGAFPTRRSRRHHDRRA